MRRAAVLLAALAAGACWSLSSLPDVTGGKSDAADGGGASDAPFAEDGRTEVDGGADDGEAGSTASTFDAASPFCVVTGAATFLCEDFNGGEAGSKWTSTRVVQGGTMQFEGHAFVARTTPPCIGSTSTLIHTQIDKTAQARSSFTVVAKKRPADTLSLLVGFSWPISAGYYRIHLAVRGDHLVVVQNEASSMTFDDTPPVDITKPTRLAFSFVWSTKQVTVEVDGVQVLALTGILPESTADETNYELGMYTGDPCSGDVELLFDDVIYDRVDR
jgi:hypothetical protein